VTDHRRTEKELWEQDAVVDDERPTNVLPLFPAGTEHRARVAEAPEEEAAGHADAPRMASAASVESVATFIAQAPSEGRAGAIDSPAWSLEAMAAIEHEVEEPLREPPVQAKPPSPPPLPGRTADVALPSMMLGPAMSMRGDATERVTTIPKTHPMANSLAPGSSFRSVPPSGSRLSPVARGAVAVGLLGLLAGAALLLQSRGEHHALATRHQASATTVQPVTTLSPSQETVIVMEETPEPVLLANEAVSDTRAAPSRLEPLPAEAPSAAAPSGLARRAQVTTSIESTAVEPVAVRRSPASGAALRVAVGDVQLRDRSAASTTAQQPERAAIVSAMNAIASELRACVGDEHGIADVTLTVRNTGAVSHALVEGAFAGSPAGSCIARTLRAARLPALGDGVLHIVYPLQL
jgi:hypothetical protein